MDFNIHPFGNACVYNSRHPLSGMEADQDAWWHDVPHVLCLFGGGHYSGVAIRAMLMEEMPGHGIDYHPIRRDGNINCDVKVHTTIFSSKVHVCTVRASS